MRNECNCTIVWTFFGTGMKTDLLQSCAHCWIFHICWHIERSNLISMDKKRKEKNLHLMPYANNSFFLSSFLFWLHWVFVKLPWWLRQLRICLPCRRPRFNPGSGRSPGKENGNPLQYSCLENPMDRGATVRGVAKSQTWLSNQHFHFHFRWFWCSPKYKHRWFRWVKKSYPEPGSSLNYLMSVT